jgi:hypothetical protein
VGHLSQTPFLEYNSKESIDAVHSSYSLLNQIDEIKKSMLYMSVVTYGAACAFRFSWGGGGSISEAKLGCKITEKMKIGGDIFKMHARDGATLRNWVQAVAPLNPGSGQVHRGCVCIPIYLGKGIFLKQNSGLKTFQISFNTPRNEMKCPGTLCSPLDKRLWLEHDSAMGDVL